MGKKLPVPRNGEHEAANAALWERLGFGVSLQRWRESGCSADILEEVRTRLVAARAVTPSFPEGEP